MTIIIGGHERGLLDGSAALLERNDRVGGGGLGGGEEVLANVSNGNLVVQERDAFLSSKGVELALVRTYNSRAELAGEHGADGERGGGGDDGWRLSTEVTLERHRDTFADGRKADGYSVTYGDGTEARFVFDFKRCLWVSTDGAGTYETLQVNDHPRKGEPAYVLTRADRTRYQFDTSKRLEAVVDRNGVRTEYCYDGRRLTQVREVGGHAMNFVYRDNRLLKVVDERGTVLVRYDYSVPRGGKHDGADTQTAIMEGQDRQDGQSDSKGGPARLVAVTDRAGLTTRYTYHPDGTLAGIELPRQPATAGTATSGAVRKLAFEYTRVPVEGKGNPKTTQALSRLVDASGAVTTFEYDFKFSASMAADDRDLRFAVDRPRQQAERGSEVQANDVNTTEGRDHDKTRFFVGGSTQVVDALGNARATSNAAEYVAWRCANGYYARYDAAAIACDPKLKAQFDAIRATRSLALRYDADGYLVQVSDPLGFTTRYTYDLRDNLTSVKTELAKPAAKASTATVVSTARTATTTALGPEIAQNLSYEYDANGNKAAVIDGDGHRTSYTHTATGQLASMTAAMGDALATLDDLAPADGWYRAKRVALGFGDSAASALTAAQRSAIRELYTTRYTYDANDRLIRQVDAGGDRTDFEYTPFGKLSQRTAYLDPADLVTPSKQQVTRYAYDAFGNNTSIVDAEGGTTTRSYDSFGNLLTELDPRGGLSRYSYDGANRLLTRIDALGASTAYAYDAVGNQIRITDASGHVITQVFDANNQLLASIESSLAGAAQERSTNYRYDVTGNRTEVTNAAGHTTRYQYDARNRVIDIETPQVTNAAGQTVTYRERYSYDALGNLLTLTDHNGAVSTYTYTAAGLLKSLTNAAGNVTEYLYDANLQQVQVTVGARLSSGLRRVLKFEHDEENQVTRRTDALGGAETMAYDAVGNVRSVTDKLGRTTDYTYDRNNRRLTETHPQVTDPATGLPVRHTVTHQFDANGNQITTTDENGRTTTISFDRNDRRVMVSDANGIETVYAYDSRGNVVRVSIGVQARVLADGSIVIDDASTGNVTSYAYGEFGDLVSMTDGVGNALATSDAAQYQQMRQRLGYAATAAALSAADRTAILAAYTTSTTYDKMGQQLTETDKLGHVSSTTYDAMGRMTRHARALDATATRSLAYVYDGYSNVVRATDGLGRSRNYVYDALQRMSEAVDSLGVRERYAYDALGNRSSATRAFGTANARTTTWFYDRNNRIAFQTDAAGGVTRYEYDAVGNRLRTTDARGAATQYVYDARNRNIRVIDALNFETRYEYDGANNRITEIDPRGGIRRLQYDAGNRYLQTTDAEGRITRFEYDLLGKVVTQTSAFGLSEAQTTRFAYDAAGNLLQVTDADGKLLTSEYDAEFNLLAASDANGNVTRYGYDALDRRIRVTDALGGITTWAYDIAGNTLAQTDANGNTTRYTYDANDRLLTQTDALGIVTAYQSDAFGNRASITRAAGTALARASTFAYDRNDRLVQETDALGAITRYAWDTHGNLTSKTDALGRVTTYGYDTRNRVNSIRDALGNTTQYGYDGNGNRTSITDANSRVVQRSYYNANNEVSFSVDALNFATAYRYDGNGNRTAKTAYANVANVTGALPVVTASAADQTSSFSYDKLNRMVGTVDALGFSTTMRYDAASNLLETRQQLDKAATPRVATVRHAYDAANRRIATLSAEGWLTTTGYDAGGRRVSVNRYDTRFAPTAAGGAPTTGSGTGRLTSTTWDALNRELSETDALGKLTRFEYDSFGNRNAKVDAAGSVIERRTTLRYDAADRVTESTDALGTLTRTLRDAVGNALEVRQAAGTAAERLTAYTYDALDRVSRSTDANGTVTQNTYDRVGNLQQRDIATGTTELRSERWAYSARNEVLSETNALGFVTAHSYDGFGNRTRSVAGSGQAAAVTLDYRYDANNRQVAEVDGTGAETRYRLDGAGNRLETTQLAAAYDPVTRAPVTTYQGVPIAGQDRRTLFAHDLDHRLVQVTDPLGGVTSYQVDAHGNQVRITDAKGGVTTNSFDALGRIVRNQVSGERGGVVVTSEYDPLGNVLRMVQGFADDSDLRQTTYQYDRLGRRTDITEYDRVAQRTATSVFAQAYSTRISYDVFGNQTSLTQGVYGLSVGSAGYDAAKAARVRLQVASFSYNKLDQLVSATDGVGNRTAYVLDRFGNRLRQTTGDGSTDARSVDFIYDQRNQMLTRSDAEGGRVTLEYDAVGNQTSRDIGGAGGSRRTLYGYDKAGRVVQETNPLGTVTRHVYNAFGNEVQTTFAAGTTDERITRGEFNKNNDLTADIDALGNRTAYQVDKLGNRIAETDARGNVTRLYFNSRNQQTATLDAEGYLSSFERDAAGNVVRTQVYLNRYTAPADGLVAPVPGASDPVRATLSEYDVGNRLVRQTAPDGMVQEYLRDSVGKLSTQTTRPSSDAAAVARTANLAPRVQRFEYDGAGRLVRYVAADGVVESYAYDTANNKVSQTISNPNTLASGSAEPVQRTDFAYDGNNRLKTQTADPAGLRLVNALAYDAAGNVVRKTDGRGNVTVSTYDLNDRLTEVADPLGNRVRFAYDRVGNRTSITDARGNTTNYEFDLADRVVRELSPAVSVDTITGGVVNGVRPTTLKAYDAVGNLVQETNANGYKTTNFYDSTNLLVAEINADNVLRRYSYDAAGALTSATLFMTRVAATAHNPAVVPATPAGVANAITTQYDSAGRLMRKVYPQIEVTTLTGTDGSTPVATTALRAPDEQNFFDAFGNLVESTDKNTNRGWAWFDARGRSVATVDAAGYLVESSYDSQGNVVQQRSYRTPLVLANVRASVKPSAPLADADIIDRTYDAAGRLAQERSAAVKIGESGATDVTERVLTTFTYDADGNRTGRTIAAGTADAVSEHEWFDAANRRVAVVSAARTLSIFTYDADGNLSEQRRYINAVPATLVLPATLEAVRAAVAADDSRDQITRYTRDALGRMLTQTEVMSGGSANHIVRSTAYDAMGNATRRTDPLGNMTSTAYDGVGHLVRTLTPDGAEALVEYDAAGLKVRAFAGAALRTVPPVATNLVAQFTGPSSTDASLKIEWKQTGAGSRSWVVWDSVARNIPAGSSPLDLYTNRTESVFTQPGSVNQDNTAVLSSDAIRRAAALYYRVVSENSLGHLSWSAEQQLTLPVLISDLTTQRSGTSVLVRARFNKAPPAAPFVRTDTSATHNFALQADGSWLATILNVTDPTKASFEVFWRPDANAASPDFRNGGVAFRVGGTAITSAGPGRSGIAIPQIDGQPIGNGQIVFVAGEIDSTASRVGNLLTFGGVSGSTSLDIFFGNTAAADHTVTLTRPTGLVLITLRLGAGEAAVGAPQLTRLNAFPLTAESMVVQADGSFVTGIPASAGGVYSFQIRYVNAAGREVFVTQRGGNIAIGATAVFSARSLELLGQILAIVPQSPSSGSYFGTVDPPSVWLQQPWTLPAAASASSGTGSLVFDGPKLQRYFTEIRYNALGDRMGSNEDGGLWRSYGVDANGNALVTRLYGTQQDETAHLAGTPGHAPIVTYAGYDARNLETARFGAATAVAGQAGLVRAVTRSTWDHDRRKTSQLDPGDATASRWQYDGVGNLIRAADALGQATRHVFDRRGNLVRIIDARGNASTMAYDAADAVITETDALNRVTRTVRDSFGRALSVTDPLNRTRSIAWDQRSRQVSYTDALGFITRRHYDKADREIWYEDANGHWFGKAYDAMGRLTHEYSFQSNSPVSLATAQAALSPTNTRFANLSDTTTVYDVFGNVEQKIDGAGRIEYVVSGAFGREAASGNGQLSSTIEYDRFGRVVGERNSKGQDIVRSWDDAGRLTVINDRATGVRAEYSYFANGERASELVFQGGLRRRDAAYTYDALERVTGWTEAMQGEDLNWQYDASGNVLRVFDTDLNSVNTFYTYDAADQLASKQALGQVVSNYSYDAAGNRTADNTSVFRYDAENRLVKAPLANHIYDNVGNMLNFGGGQYYTYTDNNLQLTSRQGSSTTTSVYDKAGRLTERVVRSPTASPIFYDYGYNEFDKESGISVSQVGSQGSSTASAFDANGRIVSWNRDPNTTSIDRRFTYDGAGNILTRQGPTGTPTQYYYVNDKPVGEGFVLAEGAYDIDQPISSADRPSLTPNLYTVRGGETLQALAASYYGNASLWFLIADANGLSGAEQLAVGTQLKIPNSVTVGRLNADTHVLYREGVITGGKQPGLSPLEAAPPPPVATVDQCAVIGAIILVVVVAILAVVLTVITVGIAAPAAAAALGVSATSAAGIIVGVAIGAAVGAGISFAASAINQGILITAGLQEGFDWNQVAADVVVGAIGGAAAGLAAAAQVAIKAAQWGVTATRVARVGVVLGETAAELSAEAGAQAIVGGGRIEEPWMLVASAVGPGLGEAAGQIGKRAVRAIKAARAAGDAAEAGGKAVKFTLPDGSVVAKGTNSIAGQSGNAGSAIAAADAAFTGGPKASLGLQQAGAFFKANGSLHGLKPLGLASTTGNLISAVQSPSQLDQVAKGAVQDAAAQLNAGQAGGFNNASVVDFAQGTVGKVNNNVVSLADMTGLLPAQAVPAPDSRALDSLLDDIDALAADADLLTQAFKNVQVKEADLPAQVEQFADDIQKGVDPSDADRIAAAKAKIPSGDSNPTNAASNSTSNVTSNAATGAPAQKQLTAAAQSQKTVQTINHFPKLSSNEYSDRLDQLVAQAGARPSDLSGLPRLPDYNNFNPAELDSLRKIMKDHLGDDLWGRSMTKIMDRQMDYPEIENASPDDLLAAYVYTLEDSPLTMGGRALDDTMTYFDSSGVKKIAGDFRVLNNTLRSQDAGKLAELDPYLRLTSTSLNHFPEYQGVVYRGLGSNATSYVESTFLPGAIVPERGFTSTAASPTAPFNFHPETLFVVNSRSGNNIAAVSEFPEETEVLFRPNTRFKVLAVEDVAPGTDLFGKVNNVKKIVYLDQVPTV